MSTWHFLFLNEKVRSSSKEERLDCELLCHNSKANNHQVVFWFLVGTCEQVEFYLTTASNLVCCLQLSASKNPHHVLEKELNTFFAAFPQLVAYLPVHGAGKIHCCTAVTYSIGSIGFVDLLIMILGKCLRMLSRKKHA